MPLAKEKDGLGTWNCLSFVNICLVLGRLTIINNCWYWRDVLLLLQGLGLHNLQCGYLFSPYVGGGMIISSANLKGSSISSMCT